MTYGPGEPLPDMHLDPPSERRTCSPEDFVECPACQRYRTPNDGCRACEDEEVRDNLCRCESCDICGAEPVANCDGHQDVEALLKEGF